MKKALLALAVFFSVSPAIAQDTADRFMWHYALGAVINPDFNINNNLLAAGGHRIADVSPSVSIGWSVIKDRISLDFDFGAAATLYGRKNSGYNLVQMPLSVKVQYLLIDKEKIALSAGVNGSYVFYDLSIYNDDTEIDMDNLDPAANSGYIRLNNQSVYAGPAMAFTFFRHKSQPLKLSVGYDFAVTDSKWKADYASLGNVVKENGGRAYVQLNIPFGTIGKMWGHTEEE